jgi:hypothetical protein
VVFQGKCPIKHASTSNDIYFKGRINRITGKRKEYPMNLTTTTRAVGARTADLRVDAEPTVLAKAITAFAFSDQAVRHCGHGLPPILPWRQDDWTLTEFLKSDLRRYSIIDRAVLSKLEILDRARIEYDHIYVGHQDKKPFRVPQKVISAVTSTLPVLAFITGALLAILATTANIIAQVAMVMVADPVVVVAIREADGSYNLLEIAKWYS